MNNKEEIDYDLLRKVRGFCTDFEDLEDKRDGKELKRLFLKHEIDAEDRRVVSYMQMLSQKRTRVVEKQSESYRNEIYQAIPLVGFVLDIITLPRRVQLHFVKRKIQNKVDNLLK